MKSIKYIFFVLVCFVVRTGFAQTEPIQNDTLYIFDPGGPYPAIKEVADLFSKKQNIPIKVIKGPFAQWKEQAKTQADLIYSGSEFMMTQFEKELPIIKESVCPLYLRKSGLIVRPNNPKNIQQWSDLQQPNINIMVVNGAGLTGVWEDIAGRDKNIESLRALRKNIVFYAENSGQAQKKWLENNTIDVWITWEIWQKRNPNTAEFIHLDEVHTVYRDFGIALAENTQPHHMASSFLDFLKSHYAETIFEKWGWITQKQ
ncbi:substrate-binding domain-containing protein [Riemerella columbina]|uniref:substrate-binding domain-containing protein n=1 Tax=Riemerella columbina TaxID=103810 RepID=UPI000378106A|nr:substrate-binding domain-containing protein [Riemerella columbina]